MKNPIMFVTNVPVSTDRKDDRDIISCNKFIRCSYPDDHTNPSKIMFGYYDLDIVSSKAAFYYTPIVRYTDSLTYWTVSLTGFEIGTSDEFVTADDVPVVFSVCTYGYVGYEQYCVFYLLSLIIYY